MTKKNVKKLIAIICAIAILPWGYFTQNATLRAEASTAVTAPDELERWTVADNGFVNGAYATTNGIANGKSLDKKAFSTKITFPNLNSSWRLSTFGLNGTPSQANVMYFMVYDKASEADEMHFVIQNKVDVQIDLSQFNITALVGNEIDLTVTTEFINNNETTTDVNVGIYINGMLHNGEYLLIKDLPVDALKQQACVWTPHGGSVSLRVPVTKPSDLEVWDIDTVQFPSRSVTTNGNTGLGTATGKNQDGTAFRTKITFPSGMSADAHYSLMWLGNPNNGYALRSNPATGENNLQFWLRDNTGGYPLSATTITPADFNMTTPLVGQQLELIITSELVATTDGKTAALVGLYINGNLYKGDYIVVKNVYAGGVPQNLNIINNYGGGHTKVDVFPTRPSELNSWNIGDVGLADNAYGGNVSGVETGKSLNKTAFTTDIILPEVPESNREAVTFIGGFGKGYAISVKSNVVKFQLWDSGTINIATLTAAEAGVEGLTTLLGQKFNLTITTEFVNYNGTTTDVYIGLYINDVLYGGNYFRLTGRNASVFAQQVYVYNQWAGGKTTWLGIPVTPLAEFERWDITDVGLSEGEYSIQNGTATGATQDMKALYTMVQFPYVDGTNKNAELHIGEQYNGIAFVVENGGLALYHYYNGGSGRGRLLTFNPSVAGDYTSLLDTKIELIVTTEFINSNGITTDARIGVYFDGNLYNDQYVTLEDVPVTSLKQQIQVFNRWSGGKTTWLSPTLRSEQKQVTPWEELERWTITDVGLSEGEFGGNKAGTATGETLDGKAFAAAVKFPAGIDSSHNACLFVGDFTDQIANGFAFEVKQDVVTLSHYANGTTHRIATLSPETAQRASLVGDEMDVVLTVEFENNDGTTTDADVALYIDGHLYGETYFRLEDVPVSSFPQQIYVYNKWAGGKTIWMSPYLRQEAPPITDPDTLEKWTIETVGLSEGEYSIKTATATGDDLDGKALYAAVKMPVISDTKHNAELWIGEYMNGFYFESKNNQLTLRYFVDGVTDQVVATLSPQVVGMETFLGQKMDIIFTTEFENNNGTTADVNIGLYINGVFYGNRYLRVTGAPLTSLKQQLHVNNRWAGGKTTWLWVDSQSDLEELTAEDFGLANKTVNNTTYVATADNASLKATGISMELTMPDKKDNVIYFGGEECGVVLKTQGDGKLVLAYADANGREQYIATLSPDKVNLKTLTNQSIGLKLAFKIYEAKNTLELGVFVNGKLYNEAYFTVKDVEIDALQRVIGVHAKDAKIVISNPQYEELTFNDFSILDVKLDTEKVSPSYQKYNHYDFDLLGKTAVSGTVNFPNKKGANLVIGGERWQGIQFNSLAEGRIEVAYSPTKGSAKFFYLEPSVAGMESLTGTDLELRITFDIVEMSSKRSDLKMGIYINGKLYNDQFFVVTDVDTTVLTRTLYICTVVGPIKIESVKQPIDLAIYGLGADWKKTLGVK